MVMAAYLGNYNILPTPDSRTVVVYPEDSDMSVLAWKSVSLRLGTQRTTNNTTMPHYEKVSTSYEEDKPFLSSEGYRPDDQNPPRDGDRLLQSRFLKTHSILFAIHAALIFLNVAFFIRATTSTAICHTNNELDKAVFEKTFCEWKRTTHFAIFFR